MMTRMFRVNYGSTWSQCGSFGIGLMGECDLVLIVCAERDI